MQRKKKKKNRGTKQQIGYAKINREQKQKQQDSINSNKLKTTNQ
jgi:hypothetical protein